MGLASRRRYRWTRGPGQRLLGRGVHRGRASSTPPRSTTSRRSSPPSARAARPGCATCWAPSRPTRTPSSGPGRRGPWSSTAARAPARRWSPCTARPTCSTPTRGWGTGAAACSSSARTRPTSPTSATCCPASARKACRRAPSATWCRRRRRRPEADPQVAALKADLRMVAAIEPAVRLYEEPPTEGIHVETPWGDVWISAAEWAEAFDSPDPGTPHNLARDDVWDEVLTILVDKAARRRRGPLPRRVRRVARPPRRAARHVRPGLAADRAHRPRRRPLGRAGLPAPLRSLARARRGPGPASRRPRGVDDADLPLLDAARLRLGDPEASRRRRRTQAAEARERARMGEVIDDLRTTARETGADELGDGWCRCSSTTTCRRRAGRRRGAPDDRRRPPDRAVRPRRRRRGAGAQRRRVADAAASLPLAQPHRRR